MIVSLELLKAHLNITFDSDDALLTHKLAAAHDDVDSYLGWKLADEYSEYAPGNESDAPAAIKEAVLQRAAQLYENRIPIEGERNSDSSCWADGLRAYRNWWGEA